MLGVWGYGLGSVVEGLALGVKCFGSVGVMGLRLWVSKESGSVRDVEVPWDTRLNVARNITPVRTYLEGQDLVCLLMTPISTLTISLLSPPDPKPKIT